MTTPSGNPPPNTTETNTRMSGSQARPTEKIESVTQLSAAIALAVILLIALGMRISYLKHFDYRSFEMAGDNAQHYNIAKNIALGRGPVTDFVTTFWFRHPTIPAMSDFYPPGFHISVAIAFICFDESIVVARSVAIAWSLASIAFMYLFASELRGRAIGLWASVFWAMNPVEITHAVAVMAESQFCALFLASLAVAAMAAKQSRPWLWGVSALLAGMAGVTKSLGYPLFVSVFVAMIYSTYSTKRGCRASLVSGVVMLSAFCLAILPWAIATYRYFGQPMYSNGSKLFLTIDWVQCIYETAPPTWRSFMEQAPPGFVWRTRLWHIWQTVASTPGSFAFGFVGVALCIAGIIVRRDIKSLSLVAVGILYYLFVLVAVYGYLSWRVRYLLPCFAMMCPLAAAPLCLILNCKKLNMQRRWRFILITAGLLVLGVLVTKPPPPSLDHHRIEAFERLGRWARQHLPADAVLMTGSLPQEINYYTQRRCVIDPYRVYLGAVRMGTEKRDLSIFANRAIDEIRYYDVDYLVIYPESPQTETIEGILSGFSSLRISEVYADDTGYLYVYKINK